jgi:hypothetical protein
VRASNSPEERNIKTYFLFSAEDHFPSATVAAYLSHYDLSCVDISGSLTIPHGMEDMQL